MKLIPAIFLDRDGTINIDHGYVYKIDEFEFIDGVIEAMRILKDNGYALVIVTNQSGIARGKFTEDQLKTLNKWINLSLANFGIALDGIYYCPHHPQGTVKKYCKVCYCRKPHSGMFISAYEYLHIDMAASYMVGDKLEDMLAASEAGIGTKVLVRTGTYVATDAPKVADLIINSLSDLPKKITKLNKI